MLFRTILTAFAIAVLATGSAMADDVVSLKPGTGQEVTEQNCAACHTLNYIRMNAPFLSAAAWTAEVTKMRKVFGAPIDDADATVIITYLTAQYGAPTK